MRGIFKKNNHLIFKNFISMCLRRETALSVTYCSAVSFTRNSRQTLPYRETAPRKIQSYPRC